MSVGVFNPTPVSTINKDCSNAIKSGPRYNTCQNNVKFPTFCNSGKYKLSVFSIVFFFFHVLSVKAQSFLLRQVSCLPLLKPIQNGHLYQTSQTCPKPQLSKAVIY